MTYIMFWNEKGRGYIDSEHLGLIYLAHCATFIQITFQKNIYSCRKAIHSP
jgi:hypothetical protein